MSHADGSADVDRRPAVDAASLELALDDLQNVGFHVVERALDEGFVLETRERLKSALDAARREVGEARLARANELGVVRAPLQFDPFFARYLEIPFVLAVVDATVGPTAVLHLQNGFVLPSFETPATTPSVFQNSFHRDFPRHLDGFLASVNAFVALSPFTPESGATLVVPGSHQRATRPSDVCITRRAVPVECAAGSIIFFDSTLWHAGGRNTSGADRFALNLQFTRSYFKQQLDLVRVLPAEFQARLPERTRQLLGWYTRVPASLDEYYQAPQDRLYRAGQG